MHPYIEVFSREGRRDPPAREREGPAADERRMSRREVDHAAAAAEPHAVEPPPGWEPQPWGGAN